MNGVKSIFKSKTVITAALGFLLAALSALNVISLDGVADVSTSEGILALVSVLTGFFRTTATQQVAVSA